MALRAFSLLFCKWIGKRTISSLSIATFCEFSLLTVRSFGQWMDKNWRKSRLFNFFLSNREGKSFWVFLFVSSSPPLDWCHPHHRGVLCFDLLLMEFLRENLWVFSGKLSKVGSEKWEKARNGENWENQRIRGLEKGRGQVENRLKESPSQLKLQKMELKARNRENWEWRKIRDPEMDGST